MLVPLTCSSTLQATDLRCPWVVCCQSDESVTAAEPASRVSPGHWHTTCFLCWNVLYLQQMNTVVSSELVLFVPKSQATLQTPPQTQQAGSMLRGSDCCLLSLSLQCWCFAGLLMVQGKGTFGTLCFTEGLHRQHPYLTCCSEQAFFGRCPRVSGCLKGSKVLIVGGDVSVHLREVMCMTLRSRPIPPPLFL